MATETFLSNVSNCLNAFGKHQISSALILLESIVFSWRNEFLFFMVINLGMFFIWLQKFPLALQHNY